MLTCVLRGVKGRAGKYFTPLSAAARFCGAKIQCIDHVALPVRDIAVSKTWYAAVAGMEPFLEGDPDFCDENLAMVSSGTGDAKIALLKLPAGESPLRGSREQKGHVAFRVSHEEIRRLHSTLPQLLLAHRAHPQQPLDIDVQDYGLQLSLFVTDPDGNEIEFTGWVERDNPVRFE